MTLNRSLWIGFTASVLFTMGIGIASMVQGFRLNRTVVMLEQKTIPMAFAVGRVNGFAKDLRGKMRSRIIEKNPAEARKIDKEIQEFRARLAKEIAALPPFLNTPEQRSFWEQIGPRQEAFYASWEPVAKATADQDDHAMEKFLAQVMPRFKSLQEAVDGLEDAVQRDAKTHAAEALASISSARRFTIGIFLASVAANLAIGWAILRHTNRSIQPAVHQLEESAELIAAMARELKAANEQISNGTTEQVLSIQRTNESGERVRVEAQSHAQAASRAQSTVSSLTHLLGQVQNEVETMVGQMREVSDTSEKIKRLSAIVESIAFQTHILSLNASIEAARSGEAGRGFEVVANEVKTLARQSSEAARETADLIAGSLSAVANGSASLGQIVSSVGNVTSATAEIDRLIRSIESSSQQQAGNAGSIARALTDIETVSTRTAAAAEEVFAQQAEMAIQAQHLDRVTKTLRQLIGRGSSV